MANTRPEESCRVSACVWSRNPEEGGQRYILDYKRMWMNELLYLITPFQIYVDMLYSIKC
jgi:hypothetical protein